MSDTTRQVGEQGAKLVVTETIPAVPVRGERFIMVHPVRSGWGRVFDWVDDEPLDIHSDWMLLDDCRLLVDGPRLAAEVAELRAALERVLATWGGQDEDEIIASRDAARAALASRA